MRSMKVIAVRLATVVAAALVSGVVALRAQTPQAPDNGVQVAVPRGNSQNQAADAARQQ
jgi:hypothetical protein